jgi:hypothetical protein
MGSFWDKIILFCRWPPFAFSVLLTSADRGCPILAAFGEGGLDAASGIYQSVTDPKPKN